MADATAIVKKRLAEKKAKNPKAYMSARAIDKTKKRKKK